jgi:hypothetical protein
MRPEPEWYAEARELFARGKTKRQISRLLGKSDHSVRMAVDADARAKQANYLRRYYRKHRSKLIAQAARRRQRRKAGKGHGVRHG